MTSSINSYLNASSAAPAIGEAAGSRTQLTQDFDDFLLLLTTQLQNQDPLDPMDSTEFTNQLVQFSGLEQQISTNENLENLISMSSLQNDANMVNFIGQEVVAESETSSLIDGSAAWLYELAAPAEETKLYVRDETGRIVATADGATGSGIHELVWDGKDQNGRQLPEGLYSLSVEAKTAADLAVGTGTFIRGVTSDIQRIGGESWLRVGLQAISPGAVLSVNAPRTPQPAS